MTTIQRVINLTERVKIYLFNMPFGISVKTDQKDLKNGRVYIQIVYYARCTKTNNEQSWRGRKWYLSEHMTDDEIIKTAYAAFEAAVKHEIMEGFKVDGIVLFNPHVNFEELLKISHKEITRQ